MVALSLDFEKYSERRLQPYEDSRNGQGMPSKIGSSQTGSRGVTGVLVIALVGIVLILASRAAADTIITRSLQQSLALQQSLVFSPWTKVCVNREEWAARQVCYTSKNGRTGSGMSFVAVVLIDAGTDIEKILRVTLPLGMMLADGTSIAVDQRQAMKAPYITCINLGCFADYPAKSELIDTLSQGRDLMIRAVNGDGQLVSFALPLLDFGKAYSGPPADQTLEDH